MFRNPRWQIVLAGGIAFGVLLGLTGPASADGFPDSSVLRAADTSYHNYCHDTGFTETGTSWYSMTTLRDTTIMTIGGPVTCTTGTDVVWQEVNLPLSKRGQEQCVVVVSSTVCGSAEVRLDVAEINMGSNDWYDIRKTGIHEVGHSLGLGHYDSATNAMKSGEAGTALAWRRYEGHDLWHIDDYY